MRSLNQKQKSSKKRSQFFNDKDAIAQSEKEASKKVIAFLQKRGTITFQLN
ncbi:MAG: hypothetical protein QNJ72_23355 [Pleurocapsa sp. MO_226.B13]|nr:hypothetical protein [Pleurocapsa sp. MO_226.B13]